MQPASQQSSPQARSELVNIVMLNVKWLRQFDALKSVQRPAGRPAARRRRMTQHVLGAHCSTHAHAHAHTHTHTHTYTHIPYTTTKITTHNHILHITTQNQTQPHLPHHCLRLPHRVHIGLQVVCSGQGLYSGARLQQRRFFILSLFMSTFLPSALCGTRTIMGAHTHASMHVLMHDIT